MFAFYYSLYLEEFCSLIFFLMELFASPCHHFSFLSMLRLNQTLQEWSNVGAYSVMGLFTDTLPSFNPEEVSRRLEINFVGSVTKLVHGIHGVIKFVLLTKSYQFNC